MISIRVWNRTASWQTSGWEINLTRPFAPSALVRLGKVRWPCSSQLTIELTLIVIVAEVHQESE